MIVTVLENSDSATYQSHSDRCGVCRFGASTVAMDTYLTSVFKMAKGVDGALSDCCGAYRFGACTIAIVTYLTSVFRMAKGVDGAHPP